MNDNVRCQYFSTPYRYEIISQDSYDKEVKGLLDIAENRTKLLCKVYDSSMPKPSKASYSQSNDSLNRILATRSQMVTRSGNKSSDLKLEVTKRTGILLMRNPSNELVKVASNDYKSIINLNYMKSSKKQSNVITKVKLWDQLLESGHLNAEKWRKEFE